MKTPLIMLEEVAAEIKENTSMLEFIFKTLVITERQMISYFV